MELREYYDKELLDKSREVKTTDVSIGELLGETDIKAFVPKKEKTAYILLDRKFASTDDNETLSWDFNNHLVSGSGVSAVGDIKNITKLKIIDYFLPVGDEYLSKIIGISERLLYRRVSMLIKEFSNQAFIANGYNFHFMGKGIKYRAYSTAETALWVRHTKNTFGLDLLSESNVVNKVNYYNDGMFKFNTPIKKLDKLTLNFYAIDKIITLSKYKYRGSISLTSLTSTTVELQIVLTEDLEPIGCLGGISLIRNFTTTDPNSDALWINTINRSKGFSGYVNGANNILKLTNLYPEEDYYALVGSSFVGVAQECDLYFEPNRLLLPMEITYEE